MIKKFLVPILSLFKNNDHKIEDPRFANREAEQIGTKLVGFREQRANLPAIRHEAEQKDEAALARERHEDIMRSRGQKYVSERTIPAEEKILGPSDSETHEPKE